MFLVPRENSTSRKLDIEQASVADAGTNTDHILRSKASCCQAP